MLGRSGGCAQDTWDNWPEVLVDAVMMVVGLSLLAGLGTGLGGLIAVVRKPGQRVAC